MKYCSVCNNRNLYKFLSFGNQPLANDYTSVKNYKKFPLELCFCKICKNCQLSYFVEPKKLFSNYYYMSSVSKTTRLHIEKSIYKFSKKFFLSKRNSVIVDVGSNDGIALVALRKIGFKKILGIEPAKNLSLLSKKKGLKVINSFLDRKLSKKMANTADLVLASNVFAHTNNIHALFRNILEITNDEGVIIIEVQYLRFMIKNLSFDNIYHEHFHYWTLTSLTNFIKNFNATIVDAQTLKTHGGSLRIYIKKGILKSSKNYYKLINSEDSLGLNKLSTYKIFSENVHDRLLNIENNLKTLKMTYPKIIGYGAPAKATLLINKLRLEEFFEFIIDNNKLKQNKFVPGTNLPIKSKKFLSTRKNILIIVFAWNYFKEINNNFKKSSYKLISIRSL